MAAVHDMESAAEAEVRRCEELRAWEAELKAAQPRRAEHLAAWADAMLVFQPAAETPTADLKAAYYHT